MDKKRIMTRRNLGQKGFADIIVGAKTKEGVLDKIAKLLDFSLLAAAIEARTKPTAAKVSKGGRPAYPIEPMLKVLFLQSMYSLSDEQTQEALADRLSFRRFASFSLNDDTPDNATICRFRGLVADLGLDLLGMVNEQLDQHGIRLRRGTLVDATIIQSSSKPPKGGEVSDRDPQAGWTKKGGKFHHGYKGHVSMDQDSSLINRVKLTSADIHDSLATYEVLDQDDQASYKDKAYDSDDIRKECRAKKIKPRIIRRIYASDSPLRKARKNALNKAYSRVRCGVEKFFGTAKRSYGMGRVKYLGIVKNQLHLEMVAVSYNLKRALKILEGPSKLGLMAT